MANVLTVVIPKLLGRALTVLRENAITPQLVNTGYSLDPQERGSTVTIPVSVAQSAAAVTAANSAPANTDNTPTSVSISLDKWYESAFQLSDQQVTQIAAERDFLAPQADESVKALGNQIDSDVLGLYADVYNASGTAATTPFAVDETAWTTGARKLLNQGLAPMADRHVVLDEDAEANAISLEMFQSAAWSGSQETIREGEIGRKLGAFWWMNQSIPSHTVGTYAAGTALQLNANVAVGATTCVFKDSGGSLTGTIAEGDIFTIAGDTQQYVSNGTYTAASNLITITSFSPAAGTATSAGDAVTVVGSHVANLAFQRNAFALAYAPLAGSDFGLGNMQMIQDPVTGAVLRLEVTREYKQTTFRYDVLYGVQTVRPQLACRILG